MPKEPKLKDYYLKALHNKKRAYRHNRENYLNSPLKDPVSASNAASKAGLSAPVRPQAYEIWKNRKLNLLQHDRANF